MKRFGLLMLIVTALLATGCEVSGAKHRQTSMNEYNEIIMKYNNLSRSVTNFAKHVHTVLREDKRAKADDAFWETYDERAEKVKEEIAEIEAYDIKSLENRKIEPKLEAFIALAEDYLGIGDIIRTDIKEAEEVNAVQYDELIRISNETTLEFDVIYNAILESDK